MPPSPVAAPNDPRPPLVAIVGPTAVGKTAAGVALARRFGGEVVSADSRYLYRGMNIGVAKPSLAEREGIPHHLIDILEPDEEMSLATFQGLALATIREVLARGRLPFLVGGTPLYVNAVVEGWRIPAVPPNPEYRRELAMEIARDGLAGVVARLAAVDPIAAARSGANPRRVVRALEIYAATGMPMSALEGKGPAPFATLELGLTLERAALYRRIDDRVDAQIRRGLVEEVRGLLERGGDPSIPAFSSLGYRQLVPLPADSDALAEAVTRIKLDTHRYVRHQETWLRRNPRVIRFDVAQPDWLTRAAEQVSAFLTNHAAGSDRWGYNEPTEL